MGKALKKEERLLRWQQLNDRIVRCARCPRLRAYCREVAKTKRRAFQDWEYWGRPVPNFGDPNARLLVVGLAPAAHGANRTGRMFTGDRSGDWLFRALYKAGYANQPTSTSSDDGLQLRDCAVTAVCHCAPPKNRPTREELQECQGWLRQTLDIVPAETIVCLGRIAWDVVAREAQRRGWLDSPAPKFGHGLVVETLHGPRLIASYHPSQQNTFTGRLTEPMLDRVFRLARV